MKKLLIVATITVLCAPFLEASDEGLNGTLWCQTSVEYEMACVQTFRAASQAVEKALTDPEWSAALEQTRNYQHLPPAVIVDVDETVLDNSAFQARLALNNESFSSARWEEWVQEAQAEAIPGAREFVLFLKAKKVTLFYVTNRKNEDATVKNIRTALDPDVTPEEVLCKYEQKGWDSNKTSRRAKIAETYRIIVQLGDDYNDFTFLGKSGPEKRKRNAAAQESFWGTQWFLLSNPLYGSWERALYTYGMSREAIREEKRRHLSTKEKSRL